MKINVRQRVVSIKSLTVLYYGAPRDHSDQQKENRSKFLHGKVPVLTQVRSFGGKPTGAIQESLRKRINLYSDQDPIFCFNTASGAVSARPRPLATPAP
jgi:hypothetical protein